VARGWESKAIEDQIASAEERQSAAAPHVPAEERERRARKYGLMLSRTKVLADIEHARDSRHRDTLSKALEYIDAQIEILEGPPG
jgi:hypothetical protein